MDTRSKRGNHSVDISQQTAPSFSDEEHAPIIRILKELHPWGFNYPGGPAVEPYKHTWGDPESEEKLRKLLSGKSTAERAEEQRTEEDQPFDQGKFFSSPKDMQAEYDRRHKKL